MILLGIAVTVTFSILLLALAWRTREAHRDWILERPRLIEGRIRRFIPIGRRHGFPYGNLVVELDDETVVEKECIAPEDIDDIAGARVFMRDMASNRRDLGFLKTYQWNSNPRAIAHEVSQEFDTDAIPYRRYVSIPTFEGPGEIRVFESGIVEMEIVTGSQAVATERVIDFAREVDGDIQIRPGSILVSFELPLLTSDLVVSLYEDLAETAVAA